MLLRAAAAALLLALLVPPAAAAPPPDAFCVILFEVLPGMQGVRVLVDEETTLEERAALFPELDANGDGAITRGEGEAWRRANLSLHNGTDGVPSAQVVRLRPADGEGDGAALYTAITRQVGHTFHKQDHRQPWPVTESADLETQALREFSYPLIEGAQSFELVGGPQEASPTTTASPVSSTTTSSQSYTVTIEYVVLRAPEGWLITRVQGLDYSGRFDIAPYAREVDVPAFDTKSAPFTITLQRAPMASSTSSTGPPPTVTPTATPTLSGGGEANDGTFTIPAPGLLAALALAAVAVATRRRL